MQLDASYTPDSPSAENMGRDETMQESLVPCLRLYTWAPDAISLGCSQQIDVVDMEACRAQGVVVVKRFTGGAAVLHKDDLTYAFFWPARVPPHYRAIDLRERFKAVGVQDDISIVTYCRLSHRGSLAWFILTRLLGASDVRVYDGSWTEWGSIVGFPVER